LDCTAGLRRTAPPPAVRRARCSGCEKNLRRTIGYEQNTSGMPTSDPCDRSAAADLLLRQEPDEEEEEEEDEGDGKDKEDVDDDDTTDDGYSECA